MKVHYREIDTLKGLAILLVMLLMNILQARDTARHPGSPAAAPAKRRKLDTRRTES